MVIVVFPDESDWSKANWVFHAFAEDLRAHLPNDDKLQEEVELGETHGLMNLARLEPDLRERLIHAIVVVVEATVRGQISVKDKFPGDEEGQRMYLKSIVELLELAKASQPA
jgi:hypothetical protein